MSETAPILPESPLTRLFAASPRNAFVTMAPLPLSARLNFRARDEAAISAAGEVFGLAMPRKPCTFEANEDAVIVWLGPDEWFLGSSSEEPAALVAQITAAMKGHPHSLVDVSERSVTFAVTGARAADALNSGCPLDLGDAAFPVGSATRTVLGKTEILLARAGDEEYHVDVWRSFAPYVWAYLEEARREFEG